MTNKKEPSPAIQLLDIVWKNSVAVTGFSWDRLNRSMASALSLAIDSGMRFDPGDFAAILKKYRMNRWCGMDGGLAEGFYMLAVVTDNISAAQSFEAWKGRKPFIADGVDPPEWQHRVPRAWLRKRGRLAVGFTFGWNGEMVTVTTFAKDGSHLVACSYHPQTEKDPYANKIKHRYKITIKDIREERAARRAG
ncbi:MAG: hypothetical protein KAV00_03470 [Phycisphaerae bacterium]|nr:hypothetical protein [Phycisphaerae bacterium]